MSEYPEHERLKAISDKSQAIHDFLEWCGERGLWLAERYCTRWDHPEDPRCEDGECEMSDKMLPTHQSDHTLLAEFFKIDMDVIEVEKRAMLDALRAANENRP